MEDSQKKRKRNFFFPENTVFPRIFQWSEPKKRLLFTAEAKFLIVLAKLTIIPWANVGYEVINKKRGA